MTTPPASPIRVQSSPINRPLKSPQPVRSPKMGRRALQRNPNANQEQQSAAMPQWEQEPMCCRATTSAGPSNTSQNTSPMPSPSPASKGLDRVLLERNLEKLLIDRGKLSFVSLRPITNTQFSVFFLPGTTSDSQPLSEPPSLHRLLHLDRSRQPLDLTDIGVSLDNWSAHENSTNYSPSAVEHGRIEATMTSSMPELTTSISDQLTLDELPTPNVENDVQPADQGNVPHGDKKPVKGVRFEGIQDTLPRSRSYSGRPEATKHRSKSSKRKEHRSNRSPSTSRSNQKHADDDSDASSVCSTCSSSSSSTDDHAYQLPVRRPYGGVRVSYVPNDAIACARKRKQQVDGDKDNKNCIIS